ncbi:hypothetical protein SB6419_03671 [Klebsiella spallanzanii]|nr:hypothetical protein SB6419_03671 [Klebsiella spallanzanii]
MDAQNKTHRLLDDKMVNMAFITSFTGLTDKWFYKLISEGKFPEPIKLGRSSRWLQSEVEKWVQERIDQSGVLEILCHSSNIQSKRNDTCPNPSISIKRLRHSSPARH